MENISITKALLFFYLLIGISLLQPLLSKQWKKMVEENRLIQHIIGFTTMLTLVILVSEESADYLHLVVGSIIAYVWFIFSTKMDIHFNVIIILMLLGNYMYDNHLKTRNNIVLKDNILSDEQKNKIINENNKSRKYVMFAMMGIIVGGMILYSKKKEGQYGGGFSLYNFMLY